MTRAFYKSVAIVMATLFVLVSCNKSEIFNVDESGEVQTIQVIGPQDVVFEPTVSTRGTEIAPSGALRFTWAVGDTLGIFPTKGNQVEFPISSSDGGSSAIFDGGGWALKTNASYSAYYPFSVWNYFKDNKTIKLDYSGQVQDGNGTFGHLSAYDFLASSLTDPVNGRVTFQMNRVGAILYIDIVVPTPSTIDSLVISCEEQIFTETAKLDISGTNPVVNPVRMTDKLTLYFKNVKTTEENETVRAYMAVLPVDFSEKAVYATLYTDNGRFGAAVEPRSVDKGKAAILRFMEAFTPPLIHFADPEVKRICVEVAGWDTDGDGELSYNEAAAVTSLKVNSLNSCFLNNTTISNFDELQYFTGLTSIEDYTFKGCTNLTSSIIPESVTIIGDNAFLNCIRLASITIPESVTTIGADAFNNCKSLVSITIPESVTTIGSDAFRGCSSLVSITIPESVMNIGSAAFAMCSSLVSVAIPESVTTIGSGVFRGTNLSSIVVSDNNPIYDSRSNCNAIIETATNTLIAGCKNTVFPDSITGIGPNAFQGCRGLTSLSFNEGLLLIAKYAFSSCPDLNTPIIFPESLIELGSGAFSGSDNIPYVVFQNSTPPTTPIEGGSVTIIFTGDYPIYVPSEAYMSNTVLVWDNSRLHSIDEFVVPGSSDGGY